jgi:hypothetical protein
MIAAHEFPDACRWRSPIASSSFPRSQGQPCQPSLCDPSSRAAAPPAHRGVGLSRFHHSGIRVRRFSGCMVRLAMVALCEHVCRRPIIRACVGADAGRFIRHWPGSHDMECVVRSTTIKTGARGDVYQAQELTHSWSGRTGGRRAGPA